MTAILYPVADTPEAAMHAPRGHAAREREAQGLAGGAVRFVTEQVGPSFATRDAALDAYAGRVDDERPGHGAPPPERLWARLVPVAAAAAAPISPTFVRGRRWPEPAAGRDGATRWRLSISYWRIGGEAAQAPPALEPTSGPARRLRRTAGGRSLDGAALNALARQTLAPMRPQQPLDIGLFEMRLPESPDIIVPDE